MPNLYQLDKDRGLSLVVAGFPVYPSTMLVSKAAVDTVGGWDSRFRRCQDFDVALRLARKFPLCFFNEVSAALGAYSTESCHPFHAKPATQTRAKLPPIGA
jgi:hypothetical protein